MTPKNDFACPAIWRPNPFHGNCMLMDYVWSKIHNSTSANTVTNLPRTCSVTVKVYLKQKGWSNYCAYRKSLSSEICLYPNASMCMLRQRECKTARCVIGPWVANLISMPCYTLPKCMWMYIIQTRKKLTRTPKLPIDSNPSRTAILPSACANLSLEIVGKVRNNKAMYQTTAA
jgi:hypothetical protein